MKTSQFKQLIKDELMRLQTLTEQSSPNSTTVFGYGNMYDNNRRKVLLEQSQRPKSYFFSFFKALRFTSFF